MNTGVRRPLSLALAAVMCGLALLSSVNAPSEAQQTASSATATVSDADSGVNATETLDGFHW